MVLQALQLVRARGDRLMANAITDRMINRFMWLFFLFVNIVYSEKRTCKGSGFAEGYKQGLVDLSLRIDKDAAEEQNQASDGEDEC